MAVWSIGVTQYEVVKSSTTVSNTIKISPGNPS